MDPTTTPALASIGIDIGKEVFHIVGFGADGKIAFRRKIKRLALIETFKQKFFNDAALFESYDTLLEKPPTKIDVVLLVTPHTQHYPQAKAALEHGINVMQERVEETWATPRLMSFLLVCFAILALTLAVVGLYGVMAFHACGRE